MAMGMIDNYRSPDMETLADGWWNDPNLLFRGGNVYRRGSLPGGRTSYSRVQVTPPAWLGQGVTPESFYGTYRGLYGGGSSQEQAIANAYLTNMQSTHAANQATQQNIDSAKNTLGGAHEQAQSSWITFQQDPARQQVLSTLTQQASPDYEMIGPAQEGAYRLRIQQAAARAANEQATRAAQRGQLFSGDALSRGASTSTIADAAGVNLAATIEAANRDARTRALEGLGEASRGYAGMDLAYENAINELNRGIALLEAGQPVQATDYLPFANLSIASNQALTDANRFEQALKDYERESAMGIEDWITLALQGIGTGIPQMLLGGLA